MFTVRETNQIYRALKVIERSSKSPDAPIFTSPELVKDYLKLTFAGKEREEFHVSFLNAQHQLIEHECMFQGSLTQTSVYPREVVRRALQLNACAVIFSHNHPSGCLEPSRADELLTQTLKSSLSLVDVRVLDHIIVAGASTRSMAETGLL
jgi:DNA repair protein RadC